MRRTTSLLILVFLFASSLLIATDRTQNVRSSSSPNNFLVNGDFETGTFEGWNVTGVCSISNSTVYEGIYSAYVSDATYDSFITQDISPLPLDPGIYLQGAIYPTQVGSVGHAQYPLDGLFLFFNYASSMQPAFHVWYLWSWNSAWNVSQSLNVTDQETFWVNLNQNTWNFISWNIAEAVKSYFTTYNLSDIVLNSIELRYHNSGESPGPFYVDDLSISNVTVAPQIVSISWTPINPLQYLPSNTTRPNVPVLVTVNITEPDQVASIILFYQSDSNSWWNTTMCYNSTTQLWIQTIPGQSNSTNTVNFFLQMFDYLGNVQSSNILSYPIQHLPLGDLNGDGRVDIRDISIVAKHFGEQTNP